ncbi:cupin domain-containing protein [Methanoculleus thermophilus]|uniref:hypothetical protein n=1 Tax=Methanoculleus thermophilus TaxID=2200 RepID=UPI002961F9DF|nr:hypothetical protein [Methanoculleus thermophilus]
MGITLAPGEPLKERRTPVDVLFSVLEGARIVEIGKDRQVENRASIPHRRINESNSTFGCSW